MQCGQAYRLIPSKAEEWYKFHKLPNSADTVPSCSLPCPGSGHGCGDLALLWGILQHLEGRRLLIQKQLLKPALGVCLQLMPHKSIHMWYDYCFGWLVGCGFFRLHPYYYFRLLVLFFILPRKAERKTVG